MNKEYLQYIRSEISGNVWLWSEKEIELRIIGPILSLVKFDIKDENTNHIVAKTFAGEEFKGTIGKHTIFGRPDGLLAKGNIEPEMPYFCFHVEQSEIPSIGEYKKQESKSADPLGQLLAAMLVAYEKNEHKRPIYGAYVSGKNWYFVVLEGLNYCVSETYVVSKDDIYDIFRILRQLKNIVIGFLKEDKVL